MNGRFIIQLVGLCVLSFIVHVLIITGVFLSALKASDSLLAHVSPLMLVVITIGVGIVLVTVLNRAAIKMIHSQKRLDTWQDRLFQRAWWCGFVLLFVVGMRVVIEFSITDEQAPSSVDSLIIHGMMNSRGQGDLFYNESGYSYAGVCESERLIPFIKQIERHGVVVSCVAHDERWALESALVDKEQFACFDSTSGSLGYFKKSSIGPDDTACGPEKSSAKDYHTRVLFSNAEIESFREVTGEEKVRILRQVGRVIAKMKGQGDIALESVTFTYSTSTDSYNFNPIGFTLSSGEVHLNSEGIETVFFQPGGRIFVK